MNIFEYVFGEYKDALVLDEGGNLHIYYPQQYDEKIYYFRDLVDSGNHWNKEDYDFMVKEEYERLKEYEILMPEDEEPDVSYVRRPYYRMRGKSVTREQAFDIIRRTDNFFNFEIPEIEEHDDFVGGINFDNWLIQKNHYPRGYGWIHVDGTIGANTLTQKFPKTIEFFFEWLKYLMKFPYLDLMIAITDCNESPSGYLEFEEWEGRFEEKGFDPYFYKTIVMGVYVHDKKIEILKEKDAEKKYREYDALYENDRQKFESDYYEKNKIEQVDLSYLKKCIESYGLDADKILEKIPSYIWKDKECVC